MVEMMESSGLADILVDWLSPLLGIFGVPEGVVKLVIFRPFSGSGSLAILSDIFESYGVDSFEGRVASCICGAGETVFYLSAVYFSTTDVKKIGGGIAIAILCTFVGIIISPIACTLFA
ncbi:MAG: hypothetical protein R3Y32_04160 [Bacillota bacterium]